jgi:2-isopropylmalate synthase
VSILARIGVRRVELTVDYPPRTSAEELDRAIKALRDSGMEVVLHGRACDEDVRRIVSHAPDGCGLYIAISKHHREHKLHGATEESAVEELCKSVTAARRQGMGYVRATLEDASRVYMEEGGGGLERFGRIIGELREAGATMVSVPDTSGLMTPRQAASFFRDLGATSTLPLSAHFHNDYGFASANTVEAALEGAEELQVSMMGIGDRNGIADLYEVVAALHDAYGMQTKVSRSGLSAAYKEFTKSTGIDQYWRHPLSGEAQTIRAGVHQSMTTRRPDGYIPKKKLENDFDGPRYTVNQFVSHKLIQAILERIGGDPGDDSSRRMAEQVAASASISGNVGISRIQEIIKAETGIEASRSQIAGVLGRQRVYVLLKLRPQFPATKIASEVGEWDDVETVEEVYGESDMIIRATIRGDRDNVITDLRKHYPEAILDLKTLFSE